MSVEQKDQSPNQNDLLKAIESEWQKSEAELAEQVSAVEPEAAQTAADAKGTDGEQQAEPDKQVTDSAETVAGDADDKATAAQTETPDQTKPTPEKPKFDQVRQQVQQELGTKLRPIEERLAKMDAIESKADALDAKLNTLIERVESRGGQATPKEEQQIQQTAEALAAAKDEIASLAVNADDDSDEVASEKLTRAEFKKRDALIDQMARRQTELQQQLAALSGEVKPMTEAQRQLQHEQSELRFVAQFRANNPDIPDEAADTALQTYYETCERYAISADNDSALKEALKDSIDRTKTRYAGAAAEGVNKQRPSTRKPSSTKDQSAAGTGVVHPGAKAQASTSRAKPTSDELLAAIARESQAS